MPVHQTIQSIQSICWDHGLWMAVPSPACQASVEN